MAKRHFTADQANAMLPLVRSIVRDVVELAQSVRGRYESLALLGLPGRDDEPVDDDVLEADQERLRECVDELQRLGIELKDFETGLIDFPSLLDGREVYLCWKLGEPTVAHWHELHAGFSGRRPLSADAVRT